MKNKNLELGRQVKVMNQEQWVMPEVELIPNNTQTWTEGDENVDRTIADHVRDMKVLDQTKQGLDHVDPRPTIT